MVWTLVNGCTVFQRGRFVRQLSVESVEHARVSSADVCDTNICIAFSYDQLLYRADQ